MKQFGSLKYCSLKQKATVPEQRCRVDDWPGNIVLTTDFSGRKSHKTVSASCHLQAIKEAVGSYYYINLILIRRNKSNYPFHSMWQKNWMKCESDEVDNHMISVNSFFFSDLCLLLLKMRTKG